MSTAIPVEGAKRSDITIAGIVLSVPAPFTEGHVLRANEAAVLNQTYAENIRNNFASVVAKAKENGATPDVATLQAKLDEYVNNYEFGVRKGGGGGTKIVDPVEREARNIAAKKVREALQKKGIKVKDVDKAKMEELVSGALEKYPQIREQAAKIVAARSEVGVEALDLE